MCKEIQLLDTKAIKERKAKLARKKRFRQSLTSWLIGLILWGICIGYGVYKYSTEYHKYTAQIEYNKEHGIGRY